MKKSTAIVSSLATVSLMIASQVFAQGMPGGMMTHGGRAPGVMGTVSAISGNTITVQSKGFGANAAVATYMVDASSATVTKNGAASSVSNIAIGDTVMIQGTVSGSNVAAKTIQDGAMQRQPGVMGKVTAVSGNTITVQSQGFGKTATQTTYTVDASSATVTKNGVASSVSNIAVGDMIQVQGTISGTSVTATSIRDGQMGQGQAPQGNGQPVVGGTVSAISGDTITITNQSSTYTVDATNAKIYAGNGSAAATISSISVGDSVMVQGTINGTSVTATSVTDHKAPAASGSSGSGKAAGMGGFLQGIGNFFSNLFGFFKK